MTTTPLFDPSQPRDWIFTFGADHIHPDTGQRLGRSYVRLHGTADSTRAEILAAFGNQWAFQYPTAARAGVDKYSLTEVPMPGADTDEPTVAADTAAIRGIVEQLRVAEREHGRQPSGDLWDAAEALTAEIRDRLTRIERLAAAR